MHSSTPSYHRALLLSRVSSDEQAEEGFSLDAQDRKLRDYCSAMGISIVDEVREEGISGFSSTLEQRPGLMRALDLAERGAIDVLITHKVDRLARNIRVALELIQRLRDRRVAYVSVSDGIDFSTPIGEMILTILASFAQWFSVNLSAESRKGKQERVRQGWSNGRPPIGYHEAQPRNLENTAHGRRVSCNCADREPWTVCTTAASVIAAIYSEYLTGEVSQADVVRDLNAAGKLSRRWNRSTVSKMLKNPVYTGCVVDGRSGEVFQGRHPAIIDAAVFQRVQEILAVHAKHSRSVGSRTRVYLLQRVIHCAACAEPMGAHTLLYRREGRTVSSYPRYRDIARIIRSNGCTVLPCHVATAIPDEQVRALLRSIPVTEQLSRAAAMHATRPNESIEQQRRRLQERRRRITRAYELGEIDDAGYDTRLREVASELDNVETHLRKPLMSQVPPPTATLADDWEYADPSAMREFMGALFERVDFNLQERRVTALHVRSGLSPLFQRSELLRETIPGVFIPDPPLRPGPAPGSSLARSIPPRLRIKYGMGLVLNSSAVELLKRPSHVRIQFNDRELKVCAVPSGASGAAQLFRVSPVWGGRRARLGGPAATAYLRAILGVSGRMDVWLSEIRVSKGNLIATLKADAPMRSDRQGIVAAAHHRQAAVIASRKCNVLHRLPPSLAHAEGLTSVRTSCGSTLHGFRTASIEQHRGTFCRRCFPERFGPVMDAE